MEKEEIFSESFATLNDEQDSLRKFREYFIIPSTADLARPTIRGADTIGDDGPSIYLCGNSLGLQPKLTRQYFDEYLNTWAQKGVFGHFRQISDTNLPPWLHADDDVREDMALIVGATAQEVAAMQTLTANLHFLMCSFYQPTEERSKILIEGKAFPSDHFAVESQIRLHGFDPQSSMVFLEPSSDTLTTEYILSVIDKYATELALILLPGVQYYTGQFFDIATITAHARDKGILIGWDLAHAVGNVPLNLHEWQVDFAAWCTYKYLNAGPGSIGGCFVHDKHGQVQSISANGKTTLQYRPRLSGWWGSQKSSRFIMANEYEPIPGAAGFQVSNTSVADLTALRATLDVFKQTSIHEIRKKSLALTSYLEQLLDLLLAEQKTSFGKTLFEIITPRSPDERGAQLSVKLEPGLLDNIMETLECQGVVVDERRPDVIRVAPAPLYNSFQDVRRFIVVLKESCERTVKE